MIGAAEVLVELWWQWMAAMSLQMAVLVVIVLLADQLVARWAWPQLRLFLWAVVLVKAVVPPTLSSPVSISRAGGEWIPSQAPIVEEAALGWQAVAFIAWAVGALAASFLAVARYRKLRTDWIGESSPLGNHPLVGVTQRAANQLGLRRVPRLRVHTGFRGPAVIGFMRPTVILPSTLIRDASPSRLEHVLLHEFAHVQRRDPLAALACLIVQIVYWYHPLVWLACWRLAALRELSCDQRVASVLRDATPEYRQTLLEIARTWIQPQTVGRLGMVPPHSLLIARLRWLERPWTRITAGHQLVGALTFAVLLACCVPLARPTPPHSAEIASYIKNDLPPIDELQGCLRLRYAVLGMMAHEERPTSGRQP